MSKIVHITSREQFLEVFGHPHFKSVLTPDEILNAVCDISSSSTVYIKRVEDDNDRNIQNS